MLPKAGKPSVTAKQICSVENCTFYLAVVSTSTQYRWSEMTENTLVMFYNFFLLHPISISCCVKNKMKGLERDLGLSFLGSVHGQTVTTGLSNLIGLLIHMT